MPHVKTTGVGVSTPQCEARTRRTTPRELFALNNIVDTASEAGLFNTLIVAIKAAFCVGTLIGPGPYTLLAPTDDAFAKLTTPAFDELFEKRGRLNDILSYHIVPGKIMARDIASMREVQTMYGASLHVIASDGDLSVENARVVRADIECSNGVIHGIDTVLVPAAEMAA